MGKSTLLAFLTKTMKDGSLQSKANASRSTTVVYNVFCEAQDKKHRQGVDVLRNLIVQMALRDRHVLQRLRAVFSRRRQRFEYSFISVWKVFGIALETVRHPNIIIVLDAIDAIEQQSAEKLLSHLWTLLGADAYSSGAQKSLKIILSSRPAQSDSFWHTTSIDGTAQRIRLENAPQGLVLDIDNSIATTLGRIVSSGKLTAKDANEFHRIIGAHSCNSFLWTRLVLSEIERSTLRSLGRTRRLVENLPNTLQDAYFRSMPRVEGEDRVFLKNLLHLLVASFRPLTVREACLLLVSVSPTTSAELEMEKFRSVDLERFLGSAFTVHGDRISFSHPSVRDYLLTIGKDPHHELYDTHGVVLVSAHEVMANSCINYLCLDSFDRPLEALQETPGDPIEQSITDLEDTMLSGEIHGTTDTVIDLSEVPFLRDNEAAEALAVDILKRKHGAYEYAALQCASHISDSLEARSTLGLSLTLLQHRSRVCFENWLRVYAASTPSETPNIEVMKRPIVLASYHGWHQLVQNLLKTSDSDDLAYLGDALFWALARGYTRVVHTLLHAHDPFSTPGPRPLYVIAATEAGVTDAIKSLLCCENISPADLNAIDEHGRSALHCAAELNHCEILAQLLGKPNINSVATDRRQQTALHYAAGCGSLEAAQALWSHDALLAQRRDSTSCTPLVRAARCGFLAIVKLLIPSAVSLNDELDNAGRSCLSYAMENLDIEMVAYLLKCGASLSSKDHDGRTCLSWAINARCTPEQSEHKVSLCSLAADHEVSVLDEPDENGWSPLFWTVETPGYPRVVETLLKADCVNVNRQDHSGRTALSWAAGGGFLAIVELLIQQQQTDMFLVNTDGKTALSYAAMSGREDIAKTLVQQAPRLKQLKDNNRRSASDWAKLNGHLDLASWLGES